MRTYHSFETAAGHPAMLAKKVSTDILGKVIADVTRGHRVMKRSVWNLADRCGRGKPLVVAQEEFKAALFLAR